MIWKVLELSRTLKEALLLIFSQHVNSVAESWDSNRAHEQFLYPLEFKSVEYISQVIYLKRAINKSLRACGMQL